MVFLVGCQLTHSALHFQEQQELVAADSSGTVCQRVTPGTLVERVCLCKHKMKAGMNDK
jgi:hypothetical protein